MIVNSRAIRLLQISLAGLLAIAALCGCQTQRVPPLDAGASSSSSVIGTLGVSGPNVVHNGHRAQYGALVRLGDHISTGAGSSAMVHLAAGGFIQLDESTDPIFDRQQVACGLCFVLTLLTGQVWVEDVAICVQVNTPDGSGCIHSKVNVEVKDTESVFTVFQGTVSPSQRPARAIGPGNQLTLASRQGRPAHVDRINRAALERVASWRANYRFHGWCCRDGALVRAPYGSCASELFSFSADELRERGVCRQSRAPQGWCCERGEVFAATPDRCRARGQFFRDERTAREACDGEGWCCQKGQVFSAPRERCRGQFSPDREQAIAACRSPSGWCCQDGSVFSANAEQCRGQFSPDREEAIAACRSPSGWCCQDGSVFSTNAEQCQGLFSAERAEVEANCRPVSGFCCAQGKVFPSTAQACPTQWFRARAQAYEACEAAVPGLCCEAGKLFPSERAKCVRGTFFMDPVEARRQCR